MIPLEPIYAPIKFGDIAKQCEEAVVPGTHSKKKRLTPTGGGPCSTVKAVIHLKHITNTPPPIRVTAAKGRPEIVEVGSLNVRGYSLVENLLRLKALGLIEERCSLRA